jgi:hypothetical protein
MLFSLNEQSEQLRRLLNEETARRLALQRDVRILRARLGLGPNDPI